MNDDVRKPRRPSPLLMIAAVVMLAVLALVAQGCSELANSDLQW